MTIRDIAAKAGVSIATVSRVINHKDHKITKETRERVLRIVEENEYVPYAKIRDKLLMGNNIVALAIPSLKSQFYAEFATCLQRKLNDNGYSLILALTDGECVAECAALDSFMQSKADGLVFFPCSHEGLQALKALRTADRNTVIVDYAGKNAIFPQVYRDFMHTAKECTKLLLDANSHRIALVLRNDSGILTQHSIISGYNAALNDFGIAHDDSLIVPDSANFKSSFDILIDAGVDAIVCQDADLAAAIYLACAQKCLSIPEDLSIIAMEDSAYSHQLSPALSAACTDAEALACASFNALLSQIKKEVTVFTAQVIRYNILMRSSIRMHQKDNIKIVIAGSMNMDIVLKVPHLPRLGETLLATQFYCWPGGKGANQAYGISRFGANAHMLGCLGNDRYGKQIYEQLTHENVNMDNVSFVSSLPTGTAYINLRIDGGNSIVVNPGANNVLNREYVYSHASIFNDARYCLVQMEIPFEAVEAIIAICADKNVRAILKPSPAQELPNSLVSGLYLMVPNKEEMCALCPLLQDPFEQARYFITRGVQNVIITLGEEGCIYVSSGIEKKFSAHPYPCIDSTGASDVFISCLAVRLAQGDDMEQAISAALWAASYSVTRVGVQNSILEQSLLDDLTSGKISVSVRP